MSADRNSSHLLKIDRLAAITDGVYAIVITLLVLDLKVPEIPGSTDAAVLTEDLRSQIPNFIAYIISFIVVAFFWMNHHHLFSALKKCDAKTLVINLGHLLFISLTPFTASLIGHYDKNQIAIILFSTNLGLASLSMVLLYKYVGGKTDWHESDAHLPPVTLRWWVAYFGPLLTIVSVAVSFFSVDLSLALWLLLPMRNSLLLRRGAGPPALDKE